MCNPRAVELLGLNEDQMKGKVAIDLDWKFLDSNSNPLPIEEYPVSRISSNRKPIRNQVFGMIRPVANDIICLTVNGFPVSDERLSGGQFLGAGLVIMGIVLVNYQQNRIGK
jgi:hypothetical protein